MDCKKSHAQCKAQCCHVCAIPEAIFERNIEKIVRPIKEIRRGAGPVIPLDLQKLDLKSEEILVVPITQDMKCCFLNEDLNCNIYEDRPNICRKFGDESHIFMTCSYQSKDGRCRSRQERRMIERQAQDRVNKLQLLS